MTQRPSDAAKALTDYVVLREEQFSHGESASVECWLEVGRATAQSKRQALTQVVQDKPGRYQAVPARSFQAVTVKVVTPKPVVTFEED